MRCPFCAQNDDRVVDSRELDDAGATRRRRVCKRCNRRFTTYERVEPTARVTVVKKDGTRVPFNRAKVLAGLQAACYKRPVPADALVAAAEAVEESLFKRGDREVDSLEVGRLTAQRLKALDAVAYIRFASVYMNFRDVDDLFEEVQAVREAQPPAQTPGQRGFGFADG
ncbi:transcriptional regulator NrdR [Phycisphaera mikurensis]|uniref:Transcriptional repressor NrdR n=1 Tax=Phycisphaera mikurensis (strain NBRC 102666 / KCTC 22515 / FYK2301M01) TaxID=1142394 RepID=I0IDE3_PHYMF|nr:transcriptional regulator NrdR [Phycisphaera mikurensis]MBB6443333.1 transcriptional repressor NrdR [Phycisphaera mikurensis]BAM03281.1 transcriptional repressor NrdR [Phycisphaera mikurensis NBRC 102666]